MSDCRLNFEERILRRLPRSPANEIISRRRLRDSRLDIARINRLMDRVRAGETLDETETITLFSIISPELRPAIPVLNDLPEPTDHPLWLDLNESAAQNILGKVCKATGRVEYSSGAEFKPYGSGFLVADDLILTNRHVADVFSMSVRGIGHFLKFGYDVRINFCREIDRWDTDPTCTKAVTEVLMLHPWFDLALLRIQEKPDGAEPLSLAIADADTTQDTRVAVVGYPSRNPDEDVEIQRQVIREFDSKHVSPGFVDEVTVKSFDGKTGRAIGHDSSTLTGNSGSPVVDLQTGNVVGLHFRGNADGLNWAVPACDIASDARIIDAGISFDGVAVAQQGPWDTAWAVV